MGFHVAALQVGEKREHVIVDSENYEEAVNAVADDAKYKGKVLRALHRLPDSLGLLMTSINTDSHVELHRAVFFDRLYRLFQEGKNFADAQAKNLEPFAPAHHLLADQGKFYTGCDISPRHFSRRTCSKRLESGFPSGKDVIRLRSENMRLHLIAALEKGMESRMIELREYRYYFLTAKDDKGFVDLVTDAMNSKKIDHDLKQIPNRGLKPLFIHRLAPRVQELLALANFLRRESKDAQEEEKKDCIEYAAFDRARYEMLIGDVSAEGYLIYHTYRDHYPLRSALPKVSVEYADVCDEVCEEKIVFKKASENLDERGVTNLSGGVIDALVSRLLANARDEAWLDDDSKS